MIDRLRLFVEDLALGGARVRVTDLIEHLVTVTALRVVDARIFFGVESVSYTHLTLPTIYSV